MKRKLKIKKLAKTTMELRNLTRHAMPPPTFSFKDKKKAVNKKACRAKYINK